METIIKHAHIDSISPPMCSVLGMQQKSVGHPYLNAGLRIFNSYVALFFLICFTQFATYDKSIGYGDTSYRTTYVYNKLE